MGIKTTLVCDACKREDVIVTFPFLWARVEIVGQDLNKHHLDYCQDCWKVAQRAMDGPAVRAAGSTITASRAAGR